MGVIEEMEHRTCYPDDLLGPLENILYCAGPHSKDPQRGREASHTSKCHYEAGVEFALNASDSVAGENPLDQETVRKSLDCLGRCPEDCRPVFREAQLSCLGITSLNVIRNFTHLQVVYLRNNRLRSLHPLGLLSCLTILDAANNNITSTEDLMPNAKLELVDLSGNKLTQLGDWSMNTRIRILKLAGNQIQSLDGDLSQNVFLRHLDLSNNALTSVASLPPTVPLEELLLSNNRIRSMHGIEPLKYLVSLTVDGNLLGSLSPISCANHPQLLFLDIRRNPGLTHVGLLDPLRNLKQLRSLYLCPGPLETTQHLRTRVIHLLPFLEYLDGLQITPEEQVEVEAAYGAELRQHHLIWESLLPGEPFVDRRILKAEEWE